MDAAGICATLGLLVFETIQLAEHVHGDPDVIILKTSETKRIVQEHVRIEDEVFAVGGAHFDTPFCRPGLWWSGWGWKCGVMEGVELVHGWMIWRESGGG
jgi:hypothetical protein